MRACARELNCLQSLQSFAIGEQLGKQSEAHRIRQELTFSLRVMTEILPSLNRTSQSGNSCFSFRVLSADSHHAANEPKMTAMPATLMEVDPRGDGGLMMTEFALTMTTRNAHTHATAKHAEDIIIFFLYKELDTRTEEFLRAKNGGSWGRDKLGGARSDARGGGRGRLNEGIGGHETRTGVLKLVNHTLVLSYTCAA